MTKYTQLSQKLALSISLIWYYNHNYGAGIALSHTGRGKSAPKCGGLSPPFVRVPCTCLPSHVVPTAVIPSRIIEMHGFRGACLHVGGIEIELTWGTGVTPCALSSFY